MVTVFQNLPKSLIYIFASEASYACLEFKAVIQVPKIFMDELHQFEIQVILSSYGRIFSPQKTLRI